MIDAGLIVITAFISPFEEERKLAKNLVKKENFFLVHVECSVEKCEERDVKGLYKKARSGEIKNFTGIDSPYEIPKDPNLIVNTENESVEESVEKIFKGILKKIR
jgi:adenylylsulfate kinase